MTEIPSWYLGFAAEIIAHLPRDIDEQQVLAWVQNPGALEQALSTVLKGGTTAVPAPSGISRDLKNDQSAEGWRLVEDVTEPAEISGEVIQVRTLTEDGGVDLFGEEVVEKVQAIESRLGQRHAEFFLDHPEQIPEEYQKYMLVFPGTIWFGTDNNHQVPCLTYRQSEWELIFGILEGGLEDRDLIVQPKID
jgi:hypothetical protein